MAYTLEQLYEMQKRVHARIIKEKGLEGVDLLPNTVLALQVEIAELANEWRGFKHWSNDREPRREKMLEEYVDCLHFFLSIARQLGLKDIPDYEPRLIEESTIEQIIELIMMIGEIRGWEDDMTPDEKWEMAFMSFTDLGHRFGLAFDQISTAYVAKNEVNHARQSNGY